MEQRIEFVRLASVEGQEFSEACSRFGISRKTGYKWMARFKAEGESGLADRSRRPKKSPGKSSGKTEPMVVKLREKHPRWGGRKGAVGFDERTDFSRMQSLVRAG